MPYTNCYKTNQSKGVIPKMKNILPLAILIFISSATYGAISAITENGETVILKEDGSWRYEDTNTAESESIETDLKKYKKSKDATFNLKSKATNVSFWINPKEWSFARGGKNEPSEYSFSIPNTDLYGMVISEGLEIKPEQLVKIAFQNAKAASPDVKIIRKEYREVNGKKVIHMVMRGTIQSIDFTYIGYYYSDKSGSTQFLTYTGTNLVDKYKSQIYSLLNGFDTQM